MLGIPYRTFSRDCFNKGAQEGLPIRGEFALTYRCGLRCQMCYTDCYNQAPFIKKELPTEKILALLNEVCDAGGLWLCLTGGDPLVHPDFKEIYRHAKSLGFILTIFTNGVSMTEEMADFLCQNRPFVIEVTQYGATQQTYEAVTQAAHSYERFRAGIDRIVKRKLPLKLKATPIQQNAHELNAMKAFAASLGVSFKFSPMIYPRLNGDPVPTTMRLSPEEIVDIWLSSLSDPEKLKEWVLSYRPGAQLLRCASGINSFAIDPCGNLLFCVSLENPSYDLTKGSFLEGFRTLYPRMRAQTFQTASYCRQCEIVPLCEKCPAHTYGEADPEEPVEFYCRIAHEKAKRLGIDMNRPVFWKDGRPTLHDPAPVSPISA